MKTGYYYIFGFLSLTVFLVIWFSGMVITWHGLFAAVSGILLLLGYMQSIDEDIKNKYNR